MNNLFRSIKLGLIATLVITGMAQPTQAQSTNPFTGLPGNPAHRPVMVKVSNEAAVRPQTGLSQADVVVEHYTEGNILRLTALYLTNLPTRIGSVRSCRLLDIELPVIFDAGILCSGTSDGVMKRFAKSVAYQSELTMINNNGAFQGANGPLFRVNTARAPHNLFGDANKALAVLQSRGKDQPTQFRSWTFSANAPAGGKAAKALTVPYATGRVGWTYDAASGLWARTMQNRPHIDRANNQQLTAANVVVLYAHHQSTDIVEDRGGSRSIEIQLWGEGAAKLFRDGKVIEGRWERPAQPNLLRFVDADGNVIPLKPGNTWIELVPIGFNIVIQ